MKYKILKEGKDFFSKNITDRNTKGSRQKKIIVTTRTLEHGFFKYEKYPLCSEACSEKLACEIAKKLGIPTANIEFAKDKDGTIGIISFLFIDFMGRHTDAKDFFNAKEFERKKICRISSIKNFLDNFGDEEFNKFLDIMVFDALVGETDRHEENWGLTKKGAKYSLSPLYDSSCNLLREFKDLKISEPFYNKEKDLSEYARKSKTCIFKEDLSGRYKHFELIEYLYQLYPKEISSKIQNLRKINRFNIKRIVNKIPQNIIDERHKNAICQYVLIRKKILMDIIKRR